VFTSVFLAGDHTLSRKIKAAADGYAAFAVIISFRGMKILTDGRSSRALDHHILGGQRFSSGERHEGIWHLSGSFTDRGTWFTTVSGEFARNRLFPAAKECRL